MIIRLTLITLFLFIGSLSSSVIAAPTDVAKFNQDYVAKFNQLVTGGATKSDALRSLLTANPDDIENVVAAVISSISDPSSGLELLRVALKFVSANQRQAILDSGLRAGMDPQAVEKAFYQPNIKAFEQLNIEMFEQLNIGGGGRSPSLS